MKHVNNPRIALYVVWDGCVQSRNDGDWHYVPPREVAQLYGVPANLCLFAWTDQPHTWRGLSLKGLLHLRPRSDGEYTLPLPLQPENLRGQTEEEISEWISHGWGPPPHLEQELYP